MCPDVFLELTSRNRPLMPRTQMLQALRMLCKGCYHISIVVAFRMDGRKRFECATCGHAFLSFMANGGKKSPFSKNIRIHVDGLAFWVCARSQEVWLGCIHKTYVKLWHVPVSVLRTLRNYDGDGMYRIVRKKTSKQNRFNERDHTWIALFC